MAVNLYDMANLWRDAEKGGQGLSPVNLSLFLCYPKALLTSLSLPMEMIAAANSVARIKRTQGAGWRCHTVAALSAAKEPIDFARGLKILPEFDLESAPSAARIFVPPIWGNPESVIEKADRLIPWLRASYEGGAQLIATGTGVCLLAEAGLLEGKVATTHWYYFDHFASKYPGVNLQRRHFITQAGQIYCCGSINSLVDLTLFFIEQQFSASVSHVIEQHFSHEINRTYDKPWYTTGTARHPDEGIIEVQQWMQHHYSEPFELRQLAAMANMSVRNFSRRFKAAVGLSPLQYGLTIRMQLARELLRDTNLSHQEIADQLGFRDQAYFSRQFKKANQLSPAAYRKMVRGKLFRVTEDKKAVAGEE